MYFAEYVENSKGVYSSNDVVADDIYTKTLENEFKELLIKKQSKVEVCEDDGFVSGIGFGVRIGLKCK